MFTADKKRKRKEKKEEFVMYIEICNEEKKVFLIRLCRSLSKQDLVSLLDRNTLARKFIVR